MRGNRILTVFLLLVCGTALADLPGGPLGVDGSWSPPTVITPSTVVTAVPATGTGSVGNPVTVRDASATLSGVVSTGTQSIAGDKTFTGSCNVNGTLTIGDASGDTVVVNSGAWTAINDLALAINGGVNGFSVDGTTLSVNGLNHNVGVGTSAPTVGWKLHSEGDALAHLPTGGVGFAADVTGEGTADYPAFWLSRNNFDQYAIAALVTDPTLPKLSAAPAGGTFFFLMNQSAPDGLIINSRSADGVIWMGADDRSVMTIRGPHTGGAGYSGGVGIGATPAVSPAQRLLVDPGDSGYPADSLRVNGQPGVDALHVYQVDATGTVFNEAGAARAFRVEASGYPNAFQVTTIGAVGVEKTLDVSGAIDGATTLAVGTGNAFTVATTGAVSAVTAGNTLAATFTNAAAVAGHPAEMVGVGAMITGGDITNYERDGVVIGQTLVDDATGSGVYGVLGAFSVIDLGHYSGHVSTSPTFFPTCTSDLRGQVRYYEDTDSSAEPSMLCACMRDLGALTYAWYHLETTTAVGGRVVCVPGS